MQGEPPTKATTPTGAVFLSYASQDASAAQRICQALRAAGIEVWFDQSELRGGDAWDHKIRDQIHDCRLFIPVISANTEGRDEGYFRREWSLAVDRTRDMDHKRAFLVPVVVDGTHEHGAAVPEKFHELQWTRLPGGETPAAFVDRILRLLTPGAPAGTRAVGGSTSEPTSVHSARRPSLSRAGIWGAAAVAAIACAYFVADKLWFARTATTTSASASPQPAPKASTPADFDPPAHSIAVLPFVNMSGDPKQEYFSEGLTEELLNSLSRINELQVAARTSSFSFQGEHPDIATVAHKLNVAAVLEGSVRRSANTVRVTAQLINGVTGFHLWSETYDRPLGDVLNVQTEIATAVASALRVRLLEDIGQRIELGGTTDPAAFDAYLRGRTIARMALSDTDEHAAIAAFTDAVRHDPHFATAFAERSLELGDYAEFNARGTEAREAFEKALADAQTALRLAPDLALGHWVLAITLKSGFLRFQQGAEEYEHALALAPGNARIVASYSRHAAELRHTDAALRAGRRAIALDPLNFHTHRTVGIALLLLRRYHEAAAAFQTAVSLQPDYVLNHALLGETQYQLGDLEASRASCELAAATAFGHICLAKTYQKMGRRADAEAALQALKGSEGDQGAYDYAMIYAQWGDIAQALDWLESALRQRDPSLTELKAEPNFDPLRQQPRFQAIERALKFPD